MYIFVYILFQEQVRSGDAGATELFELGAVMLRRKFYPAATKFLLEAIEKWDGDDQDRAQVCYHLLLVFCILATLALNHVHLKHESRRLCWATRKLNCKPKF